MEDNNDSSNLPELNIQDGIKRWYNIDSYMEALSMFIDQYSNIAVKLENLIKHNKIEEACSIVHSIKGVFGHLEMQNLHNISQKLNESLKNNDLLKVKEELRIFSSSVESAIHSINLLKDKNSKLYQKFTGEI